MNLRSLARTLSARRSVLRSRRCTAKTPGSAVTSPARVVRSAALMPPVRPPGSEPPAAESVSKLSIIPVTVPRSPRSGRSATITLAQAASAGEGLARRGGRGRPLEGGRGGGGRPGLLRVLQAPRAREKNHPEHRREDEDRPEDVPAPVHQEREVLEPPEACKCFVHGASLTHSSLRQAPQQPAASRTARVEAASSRCEKSASRFVFTTQ